MPEAQIMDGTAVARRIVADAAERAARFEAATGVPPCLATVLVGTDAASVTYVRMKQNRSRKAGIASVAVELPATSSTAEVVARIEDLSADPAVHGILLQHPVPAQVDERAAFEAIDPAKDVDGVTMRSFGAMGLGAPGFASATPAGIMALLDAYDVDPTGMHAVVIGRSPILGRPVGLLLLGRNATVTYCHSRTRDLPSVVATGDLVVAAVGRPEFVRGDWLKPGSVVIDAGYNPGPLGDVAFAEAAPVAGLISPVPGGVGPMTIAMLLAQTVDAAQAQAGLAAAGSHVG
jgi:methylenetetrahydrofolate dehydrogenase (NADP+)/methenyltetrahydrofolate cyclohydrolase